MSLRHPLGTVVHLWLYPIKSLEPQARAQAAFGPGGFTGDRASAFFVTSGHARTGKTYRGKENNLLHTVGESAAASALAARRGVAVELHGDGPHFDSGPVSLVLDRWIDELEALSGMAIDPQRFRPNLFVRAEGARTMSEADLVGGTIEVEGSTFDVLAPIKRCITVTYDIATGEAEPAVLRALATQRDNVMGIYCRPRGTGHITVGSRLWRAPKDAPPEPS